MKITVTGDDVILRKLSRLKDADDFLNIELQQWAKDTSDNYLHGEGQYPPKPRNSTYIRTGRLGRGHVWHRVRKLIVAFANYVDYRRHVIGTAKGARGPYTSVVFAHWWLWLRRIESRKPQLIKDIRKRIKREWQKQR